MSSARPTDSARVSFANEKDIEYWTRHFDASHYRLWRAICEVGDEPAAIQQYLEQTR